MRNGKYTGKQLGDSNIKYVWFKDDQWHREDGPAVEFAGGTKFWYFNGKLHRLDGHALEYSDGTKFWYYHGEHINCKSQEEFEIFIRKEKLKAFL